MIRNTTRIQKLCWIIFIIYIIGLSYFTFFAEALGRGPDGAAAAVRGFNLIPFTEIRRFWVYREVLGMRVFLLNVIGNVLAFVPCGFLLPAISRRCRKWAGVLMVGALISFLIECTQLIFNVGSFDVDDMLLNTLGVAVGFYINRMIQKKRVRKKMRNRGRSVVIRKIDADRPDQES